MCLIFFRCSWYSIFLQFIIIVNWSDSKEWRKKFSLSSTFSTHISERFSFFFSFFFLLLKSPHSLSHSIEFFFRIFYVYVKRNGNPSQEERNDEEKKGSARHSLLFHYQIWISFWWKFLVLSRKVLVWSLFSSILDSSLQRNYFISIF